MTLLEKSERYLAGRKTPVTVAQLADRFLACRSSVAKALGLIAKKRRLVVVKVGRVNWYRMP